MIVLFIAILFCIAVASSASTDTSLSEFNKCFFDSLPDENYTQEIILSKIDTDTAVKECFELIEDVRLDSVNAADETEAVEVTDETLPLPVTSSSYDTNNDNNIDTDDSSISEPPCTMALREWLEDFRDYFHDWREKYEEKYSMLQQDTLFQLRFASKMNELIVSQSVKERDTVSAYIMSLLDDDERSMMLYKLDELEGRMIRINQPFAFDFNNVMSYFLDMSKPLDDHLVEEEDLLRQEAQKHLNFFLKVLDKIRELPDDDDPEEVYNDMYAQLDDDEKIRLGDELNILDNEIWVKFGGDDFSNNNLYNTIIYFRNKAEGRHDEYVSLSVLNSNPSMHYRFLSPVEPDTVVESKDKNTIRQEAQQLLDFYQKALVAAHGEGGNLDSSMRRIYLDMCSKLDDEEEKSLVTNGMTKVKEILLPLGVDENGMDEYHNWYNIMTYYENIAKGTELEFVSSSVLVHNLDMLKRFLPYDYYDYDVDDDEENYTSNVDEDEPLVSRIESALMYKPHSDLDETWKWDNLNNDMLIDVCKEALLPLSRPDRYTRRRLIKEARECHVFQALLLEGVEVDDLDLLANTIVSDKKKVSNHKRENIDKMISMLRISDDEKADLQDYIIGMLDSEDNSDSPKPKDMETNQPKSNSTLSKLYGLLLAITILFGPLLVLLVYDIWMNKSRGYSVLLDKYEMLHEMASNIITSTWECLYSICSVPLEIVDYIVGLVRKPYELYQAARITKTIFVKSSTLNKLIGRRRRKKKELIRCSGIEDMQIDAAATGSYILVELIGSRRSVQKAIGLVQEAVGMENVEIYQPSSNTPTVQEISSVAETQIMVDYCIEEFKLHHNKDITQNQRSLRRLHVACERALCTLSSSSQASIEIDSLFEGIDFDAVITISQLEDLCRDSSPAVVVADSNTLEEQHVTHNDGSDIKSMQEEEEEEDSVPSEIGVDRSSQGMSHSTIDESITSNAHFTFELNENDPLLIFLRSQHQCIKGSVDEFYTWLVNSEDIDSMVALKEAVCEDDYLNNKVKRGCGGSGLKGFKLSTFKRVVLEYEDNHTTPDNDENKTPAASNTNEPPEELVCPISLTLMTNDPVVAADGITYERASIEDWFEKSKAKISEAREKLTNNQQSESDQRIVNNGVCSPVYGSKLDNLVLVPNTSLRNVARTYKE